ncbi:hypothetical protein METBIDRAFT_11958 [Metschnikowia bicuspidata var. bicuspidata NRRL YB-4993]|uniref:RGS domain-containing protein n=1 Tax=Metschnikowia bicuspidata var. bicuspidata NRRL YB-4993 TaxID=869754 RepID=A0A1A0HC27_9ASCO|nr:hypothetical protein METBIDRAFT_11958 [Metschnikowia bicuspidata var. bicuspidata NRRL YB-4993]OBA21443.1 hypothetical protein METBIDRAFT_11958 [Metschnikowia bicuspidata var. bicuspidata NRRL YB-4993]
MPPVHFRLPGVVPSLDEIVCSEPCALQPGPYSKAAFVDFLRLSHCAENLDFVWDVDRYLERFCQQEAVPFLDDETILENLRLVRLWTLIYDTYICRTAPREVNVPGKLLARFLAHVLPDHKEVLVLRKAVYELLSANYNDFVTSAREHHAHHILCRRPLEAVAPEALLQDHDSPHDVLSPDTIFHIISPDLLVQWEKTLETYEMLKLASSCESAGLPTRNNSAGAASTRPSSRGSSLGSVFDNIREYSGWKKTVRKLRPRRSSSEKPADDMSL